jgi:hypothetical protein
VLPYQFAPVAAAPAQLFSRTEIPPSPHLSHIPPGTHRWLSLDSEANYRKNPHPVLGADNVRYSINRHGYRTTDLDKAARDGHGKIRIVCIGSSGGFGTGLPEEATFPVVFRDLLQKHIGREAIVWNLSLGGTGADFVTRMLFSAIPVLRPHVMLFTCFPFNRREFIGETGRIFVSSAMPNWHQRLSDPEHWLFDDVCRRICNPYNDLTNMVANIKVWEALCDEAHIPWLFTTEAFAEQLEPIEFLLREPRKMVGPGVMALIRIHRSEPAGGLARDMLHAGIRPTRELAEAMFARLLEIYPADVAALPGV